MEITINVKGLEPIASILEKILSNVENTYNNAYTQGPAQVNSNPFNSTQHSPQSLLQQATQVNQTTMVQPQPNPPVDVTVPTSTTTYTVDQLAVAATTLVDSGKLAELQQLLSRFNVQALTQLPQDKYGEFATELRGLGGKI